MADELQPSWSRPPFAEGNRLSLVHGATSPRVVGPLAEQLEQQARADPSWPSYLDDPAFAGAVTSHFRSEATSTLLWIYLAERDIVSALDEVSTESTEERRGKGRTTRSSTSRRTMSVLRAWQTADARTAASASRLGLDPMSRAKISRDVAIGTVQANLATLQASGAEMVAAARARGALPSASADTTEVPTDDHSEPGEAS